MTEKDTKVEEAQAQDEDFYDDYNESDNYLIDKALGNIKDDPGSARNRPRRIPLYLIRLEDEDKIPKMPENILPKPNDEEFQKRIDALKQKSDEKKKSIDEQLEKRRQETAGAKSDDKDNPFEKKKTLSTTIKNLNKQINDDEESIAPIKNKFNALNDKVKSYERYHFGTNLKKLAQELRKIKEKISFGAISINEETELNNRKAVLEEYQKALKTFLDFKKENNETLNKTKEARNQRKELYKQRDELDKQIEELKAKKEIKKPEIVRINKIIDSLKEDKKKINEEIRQIHNDWNNQWYEYEKQQKLIQYIKDAQAKIKGLKKREKKKENKENEKEGDKTEKNTDLKIVTYKPNEKELKLQQYNDLKNYFVALLPKEQEVKAQETKGKSNYDISNDIKAGKLKKVEKKFDEQFGGDIQIGKKKKGKKPKEPKDSRKAAKKAGLTLDFEMIQKITDAGLSAPRTVEDIPKFLEELEKNKVKAEKGEKIEPPSTKEEPKKEKVQPSSVKEESKKEKKEESKPEEKKLEETKIEELKIEEQKTEEKKIEEQKTEEKKIEPKKEQKKEQKKDSKKEHKKESKKEHKKESKKEHKKE